MTLMLILILVGKELTKEQYNGFYNEFLKEKCEELNRDYKDILREKVVIES